MNICIFIYIYEIIIYIYKHIHTYVKDISHKTFSLRTNYCFSEISRLSAVFTFQASQMN